MNPRTVTIPLIGLLLFILLLVPGGVPGKTSCPQVGGSGTSPLGLIPSVSACPGASFTLGASQSSLAIPAGTTATTAIPLTDVENFSGTVSLTTSAPPVCPQPGCSTWSINPGSVSLVPNGSAVSTLTIFSGTSWPGPGKSANVTVYGTNGNLTRSVSVTFTTISSNPDFTMTPIPNSLTITQGSAGRSNIVLTSLGGFQGNVSLYPPVSCLALGCPSYSINPMTVYLAASQNASSVFTIQTSPQTALGTYQAVVTGQSGSVSHNATVTYTVVQSQGQSDFTISANPNSLNIGQSSCATSTVTVTSVNSFNGTVSVYANISPAGLTYSISPAILSVPPGGSASSTIVICSSSSTTPGYYTATVTGVGGSTSHSTTLSVNVTGSSSPNFSITANPASLNISQGSCASSIINLMSQGGFNSTVSLSVTSPPSSTSTLSRYSVTLAPGGNASSTLTVCTTSSTSPGTYTDTVTGTSGTLSHSVAVTFTVGGASSSDFAMSANPKSLSIPAGSTGTSTITFTSIGGLSGTIQVYTSPSPTCPQPGCTTWSVNPTSVTLAPNGTATSTLSVNAGTAGASGNVTVFGKSGSLLHSVNALFTVTTGGTADFTISAVPGNLTFPQGSCGTSSITVTSINNFNGTVTLTSAVSPSGLFATISPTSLPVPTGGSATATLTICSSSSTSIGSYTVIVTGTSGSISHSATVSVNVTSPASPDFSISAIPTSLTILPSSSGQSTINVTSLDTFAGTVYLKASVSPSGLAASLNPTSITLSGGGTGNSILTISTTNSTAAGSYTVTVTGTAPSISKSHSVTISVTVGRSGSPDFAISVRPATLSITQGSCATSTVTLTSLNSFNGTISLVSVISPSGPVSSLSRSTVSLPPGGTSTVTLTVCTMNTTPTGNYTDTVTGTSGSVSHSSTLAFTVVQSSPGPDFSLSANPTGLTVSPGSCGTSTITVVSVNSFNGTVALSATTPLGLTTTLSPSNVPVPPGGSASSKLTVCSSTSAPLGTYTVTVTGTSGSTSHSLTVTVTVAGSGAPDFSVSASPSNLSIQQGSCGSSTINLTSLNGFNGTVSLSTSQAPGTTATLSKSTVSLFPGGNASSTLTICTMSSTPSGNYSDTVTGTSGSLSHSVTIFFTVGQPPGPDFAISANPTFLSIPAGSTSTSTITLRGVNGFNGTVNLSTSPPPLCPQPNCSTWSISPTSVTLGPNGTATATLSIFGGTGGGSGNVTVFGNSGTVSHSVNVSFTVTGTAAPDFTLSAAPNSLSVSQGSCGTSSINLTSLNSFNGTVNLAASVSPSGLVSSLNPTSITLAPGGTASSVLTVCASSSTPAGSYTDTVTGTSGSISHAVVVTIKVPSSSPDFTITASPSTENVTRGNKATYTITVTGTNGFNGTVNLTATVSPIVAHGPTTSLQSTVGPYSTSTLTVSTSRNTPIRTYTITITAKSGTLTHTATVTLIVKR